MQRVTYRGPTDKSDRTSIYVARSGQKTYRLVKGVEVEVPDDVAKALSATDGHRFDGAKKPTTNSGGN